MDEMTRRMEQAGFRIKECRSSTRSHATVKPNRGTASK